MTRTCLLILASTLFTEASTFNFNYARKTYSFGSQTSGIQNTRLGLAVDGQTNWIESAKRVEWNSTRSRLELTFNDFQWAITFTPRGDDWLAVSSIIHNTSQQPLKLGRARLAHGLVAMPQNPEKTVALLMSGWGVWTGVKSIANNPKLLSKTLTQLHNPSSNASLNLGFLTFDRINTEQELWWDAAEKQTHISAYCDFEGYALKPGTSVTTETLLIGTVPNPLAALEGWTAHVQAHYQPKIWNSIPAGWVGWSWVDPFHVEPYESVVRRNASAIRTKLPGLALDYIWVSLGNLEDREPGNWLQWNRKLMPSGPQNLVADLKAMDFKLGLWAGAFWLSSRLTQDVAKLKDAFLLKDGKPMDGMRVGNDYGEGRPLDGPGKGFYPGTFVINSPTFWTSHKAAVNALAMSWFLNQKLFVADSGNVFTVDKPVPLPDAQISATLFGINGSPLMLGDDVDRMSPDRLEMIKHQFPRLPETATPLDLFESVDPAYPKFYHLKVNKPWDQWSLVAIFNFDKEDLRQTVNFQRLDFAPNTKVTIWDHWQERYLGIHQTALTLTVPANSVRYLRIAAERQYPWVLSTDLHIRQGQAELETVRWDETTQTLDIAAVRPPGYRGSIFLRVPKGLAAANPSRLYLAKDANDGSLVVRVPAEFGMDGKFSTSLKFILIPQNTP